METVTVAGEEVGFTFLEHLDDVAGLPAVQYRSCVDLHADGHGSGHIDDLLDVPFVAAGHVSLHMGDDDVHAAVLTQISDFLRIRILPVFGRHLQKEDVRSFHGEFLDALCSAYPVKKSNLSTKEKPWYLEFFYTPPMKISRGCIASLYEVVDSVSGRVEMRCCNDMPDSLRPRLLQDF